MLDSAGNDCREIFEHHGLKLLMIPRTAEYAIRAVVFLASRHEQAFPSHDIAKATGVPPGYMSKVLHALAKVGFVSSQRGAGGGYVLTANPGRLTLLEILIAMDPTFEPMRGSADKVEANLDEEPPTMRVRLGRAVSQLFAVLDTTTIADVVRENGSARAEDT